MNIHTRAHLPTAPATRWCARRTPSGTQQNSHPAHPLLVTAHLGYGTHPTSLETMRIAVCPGSFDPVTSGHLDVIERVAQLFDQVHVLVAVNSAKKPLFTEHERVTLLEQALKHDGYDAPRVIVSSTEGLISTYCQSVGAQVIVKGLRQNGDYEAELGQALVNRQLGRIETMFLPADPSREHISSSIVKDVALHGGNITGMVPDCVVPALLSKLAQR